MKIANRILNILVLIAALGAAVCAFFLFQKREQITKGRQMMSEAVVKTVKTIDPTVKISVDDMSIAKPAADLAAPLKVLEDNTQKIVDQRNKIAASVAAISNAVMGWKGDKAKKGEDFSDYAATASTTDASGKPVLSQLDQNTALVSARGKYYIDRNNKVQAGINQIVSTLKGKRISPVDFTPDGDKDNRKLVANLNTLNQRAKMVMNRYSAFTKLLAAFARMMGFKGDSLDVNLKDGEFNKNLDKYSKNVKAFIAEKKKLEAENKELKEQINTLKGQIKELNTNLDNEKANVTKLNGDLTKAQKEIERLKDIIDPTWREREGQKNVAKKDVDETPLLRKLRGKVVSVNEKFGFVVINLGLVNQFEDIKIDIDTGKEIPTVRKVAVPADGILTVASSLEPGKADYVCRLMVFRVGKDSSIANIVITKGGRMPKVGDVVFFSESDVRQMKEMRNNAKKAPAKKAPASKSVEDALLNM